MQSPSLHLIVYYSLLISQSLMTSLLSLSLPFSLSPIPNHFPLSLFPSHFSYFVIPSSLSVYFSFFGYTPPSPPIPLPYPLSTPFPHCLSTPPMSPSHSLSASSITLRLSIFPHLSLALSLYPLYASHSHLLLPPPISTLLHLSPHSPFPSTTTVV